MEYVCTPYPDELRLSVVVHQGRACTRIDGVGKLTAIENVDQMQDNAHAQAKGKHAQAGSGHARTNGPR